MRLLDVETLELREFCGKAIPAYAILSHRWEDEEVSFSDLENGAHGKKGWRKIERFCSLAAKWGLRYAWIDTCCIDKTNSTELAEAINSMFRWYKQSQVCFAYIFDVAADDTWEAQFVASEWFLRGWTLQELLAPSNVFFYDRYWAKMGSRKSLHRQITEATRIEETEFTDFKSASIATRMSWASKRETTRAEDLAYCLMGLFDINLPLLYGEGDKAFLRLQYEIIKQSDDDSIFAWELDGARSGLFAPSPAAFANSRYISRGRRDGCPPYFTTNRGLCIELPLLPVWPEGMHGVRYWRARLNCRKRTRENNHVFIHVVPKGADESESQFCRIGPIADEQEIANFASKMGLSGSAAVPPATILSRKNPQQFHWKELFVPQEVEYDWGSGYTGLCNTYIPPQRRRTIRGGGSAEENVYGDPHWHVNLEQIDRERLIWGLQHDTSTGLCFDHKSKFQNSFDHTQPVTIGSNLVMLWLQRLSQDYGGSRCRDPVTTIQETRQILQQLRRIQYPKGNDSDNIEDYAPSNQSLAFSRLERFLNEAVDKRHICMTLHDAARSGDVTCLKELLAAGKEMDARDVEQQTPLHVAIINGQNTVAALLIDRKADVVAKDSNGLSPLHLATLLDNEFIAKKLLSLEVVDANTKQEIASKSEGQKRHYQMSITPLHLAAVIDSAKMMTILLQHGGNPGKQKWDCGAGCMNEPCKVAVRYESLRVLKVLLACKYESDEEHCLKTMMLCASAKYGFTEAIDLLLKHGVAADCRDIIEWTPLYYACQYGQEEAAKLLLNAANNVNSNDRHYSPLDLAASGGHLHIINLLLDHGAEINPQGVFNMPLESAAIAGQEKAVRLLLSRGALPDTRWRLSTFEFKRTAGSLIEKVAQDFNIPIPRDPLNHQNLPSSKASPVPPNIRTYQRTGSRSQSVGLATSPGSSALDIDCDNRAGRGRMDSRSPSLQRRRRHQSNRKAVKPVHHHSKSSRSTHSSRSTTKSSHKRHKDHDMLGSLLRALREF